MTQADTMVYASNVPIDIKSTKMSRSNMAPIKAKNIMFKMNDERMWCNVLPKNIPVIKVDTTGV